MLQLKDPAHRNEDAGARAAAKTQHRQLNFFFFLRVLSIYLGPLEFHLLVTLLTVS